MTVSILSYNIRYGGTGREGPIANVIGACDPDLVVLQEATDPAVVASLARQTAMREWGTKPRESLGFLARRPVRRAEWHRPRLSRHAFLEILPATAETASPVPHWSAPDPSSFCAKRSMPVVALLRSSDQSTKTPPAPFPRIRAPLSIHTVALTTTPSDVHCGVPAALRR